MSLADLSRRFYPSLAAYTAEVEAARSAYRAETALEAGRCTSCGKSARPSHLRCAQCVRVRPDDLPVMARHRLVAGPLTLTWLEVA